MRAAAGVLLALILIMPLSSMAQQPDFPPGQDYYVQAFVSNDRPYVGEQILYVFRYYAYTLPAGLFKDLPPFSGFWLADVYELTTLRIETINNRQYNVGEVYAVISPARAGMLTIPAAVLEVPETLFSAGLNLETLPIAIEAQPLPDGAPETFNGAVGQFTMDASISSPQALVRQPLTFRLTLTGSGNLEQLAAPVLTLPDEWRAFANPPQYRASAVGGLRLAEKTFEWLLIPSRPGSQTIAPVIFSYFDPQNGAYRSLASPMFTVEVFPGEGEASYFAGIRGSAAPLVIRPSPRELDMTDGQGDLGPGFWLVMGTAPLITLAAAVRVYGRRPWARIQARRRRKTALRRVAHRIQRVQMFQGDRAYQLLVESVLRYFSDKTGIKDIHFDSIWDEIRDEIDNHSLIESVKNHAIQAQHSRYVPSGEAIPVKIIAARLLEALSALDAVWQGE